MGMSCRLTSPLDESEKVGLAAVKVRVCELDGVNVHLVSESTLLESGDLAKAIEVELTNEGGKVLMLEPLSKELTREPFLIQDCTTTVSRCMGLDRRRRRTEERVSCFRPFD